MQQGLRLWRRGAVYGGSGHERDGDAVQSRRPDCFSGPGNYALTNGKRTPRSVVFRVDVEDRGEPGGSNGPPPPDRYRMRIWFVDPDSSEGLSLRQAVACANPATENISAPTPDIDDGGDLFRGNQQIHPALKKTCP
jgi:hypothetical protein